MRGVMAQNLSSSLTTHAQLHPSYLSKYVAECIVAQIFGVAVLRPRDNDIRLAIKSFRFSSEPDCQLSCR